MDAINSSIQEEEVATSTVKLKEGRKIGGDIKGIVRFVLPHLEEYYAKENEMRSILNNTFKKHSINRLLSLNGLQIPDFLTHTKEHTPELQKTVAERKSAVKESMDGNR